MANGADPAAAVRELGCDDRTFADFLPVLELLLENQCEPVTGADVEREIHVPRENFGHLHDDVVGESRTLARLEQGAVDNPRRGGHGDVRRFDDLLERKRVSVA